MVGIPLMYKTKSFKIPPPRFHRVFLNLVQFPSQERGSNWDLHTATLNLPSTRFLQDLYFLILRITHVPSLINSW